DRRTAGTDADDRDVGGLQAALREHIVDHHVGTRARRAYPDLQSLEVLGRLIFASELARDRDRDLRRRAGEYNRLEVLLARLHVDGVLIGARHDIGTAADDPLDRAGAAGKVP